MKTILRNSIFMSLFNVFGRASGFIRYFLLVAFLSEDDWALISYAFGFGELARAFIDGGLDNLISRDGARKHDQVPAFLINGLLLKAILAITFFVFGFVYLYYFREIRGYSLLVVYTALSGSMMLSFTGVIRSAFTAIERMEYVFYTNLPSRFLSILLLFLSLWLGLPIVMAAGAVSAENFIWFGLLGFISLSFFKFQLNAISWQQIKYMVSESWSLALYGFFNIFYLKLDVLMIESIMGSVDHVGPYTYASQIISGITMLLTGYIIAIYPALSRYHETDEPAYQRLFNLSLIVILSFTVPVSVLLFFWSQVWMTLIPNAGIISGQVLAVLAINLNLSMLNTLVIITFTSKNRQRWLVLFTGLAVVISFLTNWVLITYYNQPGAAMASLISQVSLLVLMSITAKRLFSLPVPYIRIMQIVGISILAGVLTWLIDLPFYLIPMVYGIFLLFFIWVFRVITPKEFDAWKRALRAKD